MVRETRHLWVGNLPENIREDRIKEYFKRFGRVQSVKILSHNKDEEGEAATVAFMDIKSANKAHSVEHKIEDRLLKTDYYDPSSFVVDSNCDRATNSPRVTPEDCGPGPGGGGDFNENSSSRSSHNNSSERRDFRPGSGGGGSSSGSRGYEDSFSRQPSSRSSRSYRGGQNSSFDRNGPSSSHYSGGRPSSNSSSSWKEAPLSPRGGNSGPLNSGSASSSSVSGALASEILPVKSSSVYLNNERGAASPMSTCSSTSSKRLNGHARVTARSKLAVHPASNNSNQQRPSRRRSRSSESVSDSSGSDSGSNSRSSSSSSSGSSSSDNSRSTSNSLRNKRVTGSGQAQAQNSASGPVRKTSVASNSTVGNSQGARPVNYEEKSNCAICIRNLPMRGNGPSDLSLQDFLLHEYNNVCNVRSVRIGHSGRHGRYAVIYLATMTDVDKALNEPRLINKTYHNAEVDVILAGDEIVEDKRLHFRPTDAELEEFHPKATRTLFVGGLSRDIASSTVQEKFERFGEILEIDIKKSPAAVAAADPAAKKSCYANVQFTDLSSVCRAIRECDGDSLNSNKITLGFARAVPTKCVWCCGVAEIVKEKDIAHEFGKYGKIQDILILRSRGQALVWFDQTIKAQRAVTEMRGRYLKGSKLQVDYASHECRAAFFEQCKNSGMDMKERSKPWEIHQPHLTANENSNSPDSTYSREKYDVRRSEIRSCDSPRSSRYHPRAAGSPSPTSNNRYKPSTQAISPPRDSFSEGEGKHSYGVGSGDLRDSLNSRSKDRNRYNHRYLGSNTSSLKDPRSSSRSRYNDLRSSMVSPTSSGDEKDYLSSAGIRSSKKHNHPGDSGLSEDHGSTGSSGSNNPPEYHSSRKHLKPGDKVRRSSTDSARSSTHHDDLDLLHFKQGNPPPVAGADDVSDQSRPGTPLCDERGNNHHDFMPREQQPSTQNSRENRPVRLNLKSSEPMSLPLPKFATQMLASQIQSNSSYLTTKKERDPRLKSPNSFGLSVSTCLKSPPPPSLKSPAAGSSLSRVIPESGSNPSETSSLKPHDPRLGNAPKVNNRSSSKPATLPLIKNNPLMNDIEDISDSDREEDSKAENSNSETIAENIAETTKPEQQPAQVVTQVDPASMTLEERLKALDEKYQKWSGSANKVATPVPNTPATPGSASTSSTLPSLNINNSLPGGSESQNSSANTLSSSASSLLAVPKFSFDLNKPSQPSEIVQRLLSRKSVFDEDTKRLENLSAPVSENSIQPQTPTPAAAAISQNNPVISSPAAPPIRSLSVDQPTAVRPLVNKTVPAPMVVNTELKPAATLPTAVAQRPSSFRPSVATLSLTPTTPTIGQVRPLPVASKAPALPILGTSTSVPIKPLVDNKIRPLASTKPSATVTPTFKTTTTSHQAQSGQRRNSTLTTTTASSKSLTMCTTTVSTTKSAVEKGEASSTTSSPKTEVELTQKSPVEISSTLHPIDSCGISPLPNPIEEESGVSSTTKELDIKRNVDPLKAVMVKKEVEKFESLIKKEKMEDTKVFSTKLPPQKDPLKDGLPLMEKKHVEKSSSKHSSEKDRKDRSHSHSGHKDRKSSSTHKDVSKKIKEMKDKDLKDLFAATDTIPNHVKKEAKTHRKSSSESSEKKSSEKSHHKEHHSHSSHHSHHHSHKVKDSSEKSKSDQKRRLSDADAEAPKNKVAKVGEEKKKMEMGRIPKIKKVESSEKLKEGEKKVSSHKLKESEHKTKHSSSSSKSGDKDSSKKFKTSSEMMKSSKKRPHITSDDEAVKKKHKHSSKDKESSSSKRDKSKDSRRKSTSSQASTSGSKKSHSDTSKKQPKDLQLKDLKEASLQQHREELRRDSRSEFSDDDENEPKKFSIFDDPIIDMENPVYFSMYDKVKARRSCAAKRDREENERRQQEALLAQFNKKLKAKREKKKEDDSDSDSDKSATHESVHKKKKPMISSSSDDQSDTEQDLKKPAKVKKSAISDSSSDSSSSSASEEKAQAKKLAKKSFEKSSSMKKAKKASKTSVLDSSDEDEEMEEKKKRPKSKSDLDSKPPRKVPTKSATAKVKTEVSSSESDEDSEPVRNKAAATAVLVQNKKKAMSVKSKIRRETVDSSSDSSDSSDSDEGQQQKSRPSAPVSNPKAVSKRKSSSEQESDKNKTEKQLSEKISTATSNKTSEEQAQAKELPTEMETSKKAKSDREKLDLDKKMSKIFGTSSDEETTANVPGKIPDSDSDRASDASGPRPKTSKKVRTKKERNSSGRSSCGSRRETAESLFDQLTTEVKSEPIEPKSESSYSAFAEGVHKENSSSPPILPAKNPAAVVFKSEEVGPLDQQLQKEAQEQTELDKSIASITEDVKEKAAIKEEKDEPMPSIEDKRSVISQEETDQAVTALLGESFENSFEEKPTPMETNELPNIDDGIEAAKAVAGLESSEIKNNEVLTEPPKAEKSAAVQETAVTPTVQQPPCTSKGRGRGRGRGRGGNATVSTPVKIENNDENTPVSTRGTRGTRGSLRGNARGNGRQPSGPQILEPNLSESSDAEMKSPQNSEEIQISAGRGRGRGRGRGSRNPSTNSQSRRRSSETSTDSKTNATSVFDWPDMEEEPEMASPTLKANEQQAKQRLAVDTNLQPSVEAQNQMKSPKTPNRQRRSTGSKASPIVKEETEIVEKLSQTDSTEDKIKAILEHASKQQEMEHQQLGLLKEVVPAVSTPSSLTVYPAPMQILQRPARPATVVTVSNTTLVRTPAAVTCVQQQQATLRPQAQIVQLPTQPLPASEIARSTTKQVLLEPKATVLPPKITIPPPAKTSPRPQTISLPTQPVPLSAAQLTSVANAIVARTMTSVNAMSMLPNQPLPQIAAALHLQQPKLPQHPLPPTSATSITPVAITRPASPAVTIKSVTPQTHIAPKKRALQQIEPELPKEEPMVVTIKKETHMKPRDRFGAHLQHQTVKEEKPVKVNSLAVQEQHLAMLREQEMTIFFQALLKQGNPEHVALSLAQDMAQDRYKQALTAAAVALNNEQHFNRQPQPAHERERQSQTSSPAVPIPAHGNHRGYLPHDYPPNVIMSLNPPASPEPELSVLPNLDAYPMVWKGFLGLKNEFASVEFRYVSGCKELASASLPHDLPHQMATLRIGQRMRLEVAHLSGVRTKMQQAAEHCVLLALPCGTDSRDFEAQSRQLRSHFITYLQLKGAAGIVNVPGEHNTGEHGGYVVHVFPSCDFANETMTSIAPDLLAKVAEMEHMVIVIATVLDNKPDS